ncbi:hypothetical protein P0D72_33570 [Paraburkholderia sediminicola]|uniref:hypothetical protein n=1 Tax=Paraburkholderia sediminicola TaxID=458836 RepID=UPI0038BA92DC
MKSGKNSLTAALFGARRCSAASEREARDNLVTRHIAGIATVSDLNAAMAIGRKNKTQQ